MASKEPLEQKNGQADDDDDDDDDDQDLDVVFLREVKAPDSESDAEEGGGRLDLSGDGNGDADADADADAGADTDGAVCAVCCSDDDYDGTGIVIVCDGCGVQVHVRCYEPEPEKFEVPKGQWLCYCCRAGQDPAKTDCALCWNKGGALLPAKDGDHAWVHALCSEWIPDVMNEFCSDAGAYSLRRLDRRRFTLNQCLLCCKRKPPLRGAWVQCYYGSCRNAVHPWCLLHQTNQETGWVNRAIEDVNEVFCPKHRNHKDDTEKQKASLSKKSQSASYPAAVDPHKKKRIKVEPVQYDEPAPALPLDRSTIIKSTTLGQVWSIMKDLGYQGKLQFFAKDTEGWMAPDGVRLMRSMSEAKEKDKDIQFAFVNHKRYAEIYAQDSKDVVRWFFGHQACRQAADEFIQARMAQAEQEAELEARRRQKARAAHEASLERSRERALLQMERDREQAELDAQQDRERRDAKDAKTKEAREKRKGGMEMASGFETKTKTQKRQRHDDNDEEAAEEDENEGVDGITSLNSSFSSSSSSSSSDQDHIFEVESRMPSNFVCFNLNDDPSLVELVWVRMHASGWIEVPLRILHPELGDSDAPMFCRPKWFDLFLHHNIDEIRHLSREGEHYFRSRREAVFVYAFHSNLTMNAVPFLRIAPDSTEWNRWKDFWFDDSKPFRDREFKEDTSRTPFYDILAFACGSIFVSDSDVVMLEKLGHIDKAQKENMKKLTGRDYKTMLRYLPDIQARFLTYPNAPDREALQRDVTCWSFTNDEHVFASNHANFKHNRMHLSRIKAWDFLVNDLGWHFDALHTKKIIEKVMTADKFSRNFIGWADDPLGRGTKQNMMGITIRGDVWEAICNDTCDFSLVEGEHYFRNHEEAVSYALRQGVFDRAEEMNKLTPLDAIGSSSNKFSLSASNKSHVIDLTQTSDEACPCRYCRCPSSSPIASPKTFRDSDSFVAKKGTKRAAPPPDSGKSASGGASTVDVAKIKKEVMTVTAKKTKKDEAERTSKGKTPITSSTVFKAKAPVQASSSSSSSSSSFSSSSSSSSASSPLIAHFSAWLRGNPAATYSTMLPYHPALNEFYQSEDCVDRNKVSVRLLLKHLGWGLGEQARQERFQGAPSGYNVMEVAPWSSYHRSGGINGPPKHKLTFYVGGLPFGALDSDRVMIWGRDCFNEYSEVMSYLTKHGHGKVASSQLSTGRERISVAPAVVSEKSERIAQWKAKMYPLPESGIIGKRVRVFETRGKVVNKARDGIVTHAWVESTSTCRYGVEFDDVKAFSHGVTELSSFEAEFGHSYLRTDASNPMELDCDNENDAHDDDDGENAEELELRRQLIELKSKAQGDERSKEVEAQYEKRLQASKDQIERIKKANQLVTADMRSEITQKNREEVKLHRKINELEALLEAERLKTKVLLEGQKEHETRLRQSDRRRQHELAVMQRSIAAPLAQPSPASSSSSSSSSSSASSLSDEVIEAHRTEFNNQVANIHRNNDGVPRTNVEIINDPSNLVSNTIDYFTTVAGKKKPEKALSTMLCVTFYDFEENFNKRLGTMRSARMTAQTGVDAGGLLQAWLGDFCEQVIDFKMMSEPETMALQQLWNINGGGPPFAFDGEGHRMPAIITTRAGEPVLSLSQPLPLPQDQADPEERRIHALQEAARERMHNLFLSVGVVLSQLLREGRSIPDFLADPIFLSVLIDSDWRQLSDAELHAACRQQGLAMHTLNGADLREAIEENVVQPRAGPLASIKEGWNIVSVSDCLRGLDWATIRACFVGVSAFDARDVLQRVQLGWQHEVEEGRRETDHFQAVVTAAFLLPENEGGFSVEDARLLVQFVCARSHLDSQPIVIKAVMPSDPDRPVAVIDSVQWAQMVEGGRTKYPEGHLLRSHTCFNTLDLTYINSPDIFTPINVVRNIRHSIIKSAEFGGTSFGEE